MFEATKEEEEKKERKHMQTLLSQSRTEQRREKPRVVNVTHTRLIRLPKSDKDQRFASALHPSKKCIAYGDESGGWRMLDTSTGEVIASFENYAVSTQKICTSRVTFISFVNTGKILLCGDARGCVSLFDLTLAKRILFFPHSPLVALPSVSLAPSTTCDTAEESLLQPAPPKLDSESTYCVFIKGTGNNGETNSTTTPLEAAKTPAVKGIALSPNESFVAVTYKHSNVFKIFDCCYSMPKESLEENSFLLCEIKTECSPDISSVDFINDTTVIIRDETSAAYRVSF
jgi:WD40 repeat protein